MTESVGILKEKEVATMPDLLQLPPEIIERIVKQLGPSDLCTLRSVCSTFRDIVDHEAVWVTRSREDYNISISSTSETSCRDLYQNLLYKYGHLTGVWQRTNLSFYGELIQLRYDEEARAIEFVYLRPGNDVYQDLRRQKFLSVTTRSVRNNDSLTREEEAVIKCEEDKLVISFPSLTDQNTSPGEWRNLLETFRTLDTTRMEEGAVMKFVSVFHNRAFYVCRRVLTLEWSLEAHNQFSSGCPTLAEIPAGVFQGDYGGHGIEFIHLRDGQGVKVTGDPNVPFNQVTFRTTSPARLNLTEKTQRSLSLVKDATASQSSDQTGGSSDRYKFVVPEEVTERSPVRWRDCIGRWPAEAQIASAWFTDPRFILANLIVFSEDEFAVMFLDLRSISMFHRVKDQMNC